MGGCKIAGQVGSLRGGGGSGAAALAAMALGVSGVGGMSSGGSGSGSGGGWLGDLSWSTAIMLLMFVLLGATILVRTLCRPTTYVEHVDGVARTCVPQDPHTPRHATSHVAPPPVPHGAA